MFGFTKIKKNRQREIRFLGKCFFRYRKPLDEKQRADLEIEKKLDFLSQQASETGTNSDSNVVVSMTSYGPRLKTVHLVVESIFQQTLKPKGVLLWLDEQEFSEVSIPPQLKELQKRGLEIKFCSNTRSYKKIIPTLLEDLKDPIVTIDDDVMYPSNFMEKLVDAHHQHPDCVVAYRAHLMQIDKSGKLLPYSEWQHCIRNLPPNLRLLPTGSGGILYPPDCFSEEVCREDVFMSLCPTADDIWLKAMTLKNNVKCFVVPGENSWVEVPAYIQGTQEDCLTTENLISGNDEQLEKVFNYFNLFQRLAQ